jgi:hypothetical protein
MKKEMEEKQKQGEERNQIEKRRTARALFQFNYPQNQSCSSLAHGLTCAPAQLKIKAASPIQFIMPPSSLTKQ